MAERKKRKDNLLERACAYLGFRVEKCLNGLLDRKNRTYKRFLMDDFMNELDGLHEVEDLLKTKMFEHYHFSRNDSVRSRLQIVDNPFYGMSREQLEIELDLKESMKV